VLEKPTVRHASINSTPFYGNALVAFNRKNSSSSSSSSSNAVVFTTTTTTLTFDSDVFVLSAASSGSKISVLFGTPANK